MFKEKNVGTIDRVVRFVGAGLLTYAFFSGMVSGVWGVIALIVAAALLVSAIMKSCFLYKLIGVRTCKAE